MDIAQEFVQQVKNVSTLPPNQQYSGLLRLLSVNPTVNPYIARLNNGQDTTVKQVEELVEQAELYDGEWLAMNEVVISFIRLSNQLNAWSLMESFDLFGQYLNDLSIAFNNNSRGYLLSYLIKDTVGIIIPMATKLDYLLYYKENCRKPRLTYIAALILKIFNNIRSQLGAGDQIEAMKKSIILYMGVQLCLIYFKIDNPLLCRNIFSNMNNAQLKFSSFPMNEQLQYRYYSGKFCFIKHQFIDAYHHFQWCLAHCPVLDHPNVTRIIKYLLPIAIIIGKIPKFDTFLMLYQGRPVPFFIPVYQQLCAAITLGNLHQFNSCLNEPTTYQFLKLLNMLVPLNSKANLLILRNLVKRIWLCTDRQSRLDFDYVKVGLALLLQPNDQFVAMNHLLETGDDDATIENIFVTLIDQNLIRGKLFLKLRGVSLSKTNVFPAIAPINFVKYGNGSEGNVSSSDKWMLT